MRIQLLSFEGCPNVAEARATLFRILASHGVSTPVEEVDTASPGTADSLRRWGSPTILVNGADVGGELVPTGATCRVYRGDDGTARGCPSEELIAAAIQGKAL